MSPRPEVPFISALDRPIPHTTLPVRILEEHLINKIAAGEVVERPASVVKELVENALDAGATSLRLHLRAGGKNLIRVIDDGTGMNRTDAIMAIERHATSKIRHEDDLFRVGTLGFRGEAIPSIASVSRFDLLTRTHDSEVGTRVHIEGGRLESVDPAGCAPGTEISVASLFFNVPARRKFLRSVETELGHCVEAIHREALIRPDLDVEVTHDDRELLRAPAAPTRARRAADLLGPHGEALVPVSFRRGDLEVEALVSPVGVHRASPNGCVWLYVNGRFVRDLVLRKAVSQAYAGIVPKDRYPVVIVEVRIPPADVDVNVHPAKTEVRFAHGWELQEAVATGLRAALQEHGIRRPVATEARYRPAEPVERGPEQVGLGWTGSEAPGSEAPSSEAPPREMGEPPRSRPSVARWGWSRGSDGAASTQVASLPSVARGEASPEAPASASPASASPASASPASASSSSASSPSASSPSASPLPSAPSSPPSPALAALPGAFPLPSPPPPLTVHEPAPPPDGLLPVRRFRELRVIGQLGGTYVLTEGRGELVIIDQHAAHERVTLHRLRRDARATLGGGQRFLTPVLVDLPLARARQLGPHVDALDAWGIEVRGLGGTTFAIHAVPAPLKDADLTGLLTDLADEVAEGVTGGAFAERLDHFLATLACHTSVRAGQSLSLRDMEELLKALDEVDFSVCAHGRPVAIRVSPGELERRFHRA